MDIIVIVAMSLAIIFLGIANWQLEKTVKQQKQAIEILLESNKNLLCCVDEMIEGLKYIDTIVDKEIASNIVPE